MWWHNSESKILVALYTFMIILQAAVVYISFKIKVDDIERSESRLTKEPALTEEGTSVLYVKRISRVSGEFLLVRVCTPRY